jgi:hypothetical protein
MFTVPRAGLLHQDQSGCSGQSDDGFSGHHRQLCRVQCLAGGPVIGNRTGPCPPARLPPTLRCASPQSALQTPVNDGLNYDDEILLGGDFDGDGEYDYLVDRTATTAARANICRLTFATAPCSGVDMGPLSTNRSNAYEPDAAAISVGDKDNVPL